MKNPEVLNILNKTFIFSIICDNCDYNEENIFKQQESIEILIIIVLINNMNE